MLGVGSGLVHPTANMPNKRSVAGLCISLYLGVGELCSRRKPGANHERRELPEAKNLTSLWMRAPDKCAQVAS